MPRVGIESTISAFERAKTVHALERAATVVGTCFSMYTLYIIWPILGSIWLAFSWQTEKPVFQVSTIIYIYIYICQLYAPAVFYPQEIPGTEAESTPGP
jgi:hypothetical protein